MVRQPRSLPTRKVAAISAAVTAPVAAAVGAAVGWLLDPDRGKARRRRLADQAAALARRQVRRARQRARYEQGRLRGEVVRMAGAGRPKPADDVDVKQQIQQALHRAGVATAEITVEVSDRTAVLRGQVRSGDDIARIGKLTATVAGVHELENYLHLPGEPAPNKADALRVGATRHR